jgi:membrane-bound lytic murein transglycosylase D
MMRFFLTIYLRPEVLFSGSQTRPAGAEKRSVEGSLSRGGLVLLGLCFVGMAGCASTATMVKENLKDRPILANAFSRAISLGQDHKKPNTAKTATYPCVPNDENDPRVKRFIREYAYNQRETMRRYLARAEEYLPMVKKVTKDNAVPADLAYLFLLESGANPEARSPANALGMWQFMADTARSYGLRVDSWVDERLDPQKSTKAAVVYLKDLYGMFGCWRLAVSAYNSGENKLNKVLCQEDADEYEEICSSRRLKRETKEFYPRFLAIAHIAQNPEKYGFAAVADQGEDAREEFVPVQGSFSLDTLAEAMGSSAEALAELNPGLLRNMTPPDGQPYALRVPLGKRQILAEKLKDLDSEPAESQVVHVVHHGDNVARICKRYGVNRTRLAELNPDVNLRRRLRSGSRLVVPVQKTGTKTTLGRKNDRLSRSLEF